MAELPENNLQNMPVASPDSGPAVDPKNVFTELFGKDQSMQTSGELLNAVAQQGDLAKKSFFGNWGKDKKIAEKKTSLKLGNLVLQVSIVMFFLTGAFFYSQNSLGFSLNGENVAQKRQSAEANLRQITGEVAFQRHLAAVLLLDQFVQAADAYNYHIQTSQSAVTSKNSKEESSKQAASSKKNLSQLLSQLQEQFKQELSSEDVQSAKEVADQVVKDLQKKKGSVDDNTLVQEIQDIESAKKLLQNKDFKKIVVKTNKDKWSDEQLNEIYQQYGQIRQNVNSLISEIKMTRQNWSESWTLIEGLVKTVDPLFDTEFAGNLLMSDLSFSNSRGIQVTGKTVTDDSRNFTLISNLIDTLEASPAFEEVSARNFAKSSSDESSTGNFSINLKLQTSQPESK
jgi:hypothetical protein